MKVDTIMTQHYVTIEKDARIKDALAKMARNNTNRLIVVRRKGARKPYGIITEYDIFYRLSRSKVRRFEPYNTSVASAATTPVDTVNTGADIKFVTRNMLLKGYSSMPVLNNQGEIMGLVTKRDILKLLRDYNDVLNSEVSRITTKIKGKIRLFDRLTMALSKFMGTGYSNLVVIDDGKPIGILRAYDVAKVLFTIRKINPTPHWENVVKEIYIADIMRRDIAVLNPEAPIGKALDIILHRGQNIIPIEDRGRAVGLVSRSNILRYMLDEKII